MAGGGQGTRVARGAAADSAAQMLSMAVSLGAGIVLARSLGDEGRGAFILATTFASQFLLSFLGFGAELAAGNTVARERAPAGEVHGMLALVAAGLAAAAGLWWLAGAPAHLAALFPGLGRSESALVLLSIPCMMYQAGVYGLLVGMGDVRVRAGFDLLFNIVQSTVLVVLILGAGHRTATPLVWGYYAVLVLAMPALALAAWRRGAWWRWPARATARAFVGFGCRVWVGNLGAGLGQRIDQYFVQRAGGADLAAFGVYTLATSLAARSRILPQALSRSVQPRLARATSEQAAQLTARCFRQMLVIGLMVCATGATAAPLIPLVYTAAFAPAVVPFILFLFGQLALNTAWMLANYFSMHLGRPGIPAAVNWSLLPLQAVAAWFAVQMGGLTAVALIAVAGNFLVLAAFVVLFLRWQPTAGWRDLLLLRREDWGAWRTLLPRRKAG
jgi:O-antigen/teichoic acid export membrane protein